MAQITLEITNTGIKRIKAEGATAEERLSCLVFMQRLLPAFERFEPILQEYLTKEGGIEKT
ncbi:MAG: hypothetical protein ACYC56_08640 [Candidatus Aquicultor sp.]